MRRTQHPPTSIDFALLLPGTGRLPTNLPTPMPSSGAPSHVAPGSAPAPAASARAARGILAATVHRAARPARPARRGASTIPVCSSTIPAGALTAAGGKSALAGRARATPLYPWPKISGGRKNWPAENIWGGRFSCEFRVVLLRNGAVLLQRLRHLLDFRHEFPGWHFQPDCRRFSRDALRDGALRPKSDFVILAPNLGA